MPLCRVIAILAATLLLGAGPLRAEMALFYSTGGAAISGYDPVSYFRGKEPRKGRPELRLTWKRAVWHFANRENLAAFEANPRAYAPQFGGYCAYAMSKGQKSDTDPLAWWIHDGRLYLIHSRALLDRWLEDVAGNLAKARDHWPAILRE